MGLGQMIWIGSVVLILLVLLNQRFSSSIKWLGYASLNVVAGGLFLFLFNMIGNLFDMEIPINPITALVVGFLRIPGLISLIIIKQLIIGSI